MITATHLGTVVGNNADGLTVVTFDKVEGTSEWWKQGTTEFLGNIPGALPGDRVILEYERGFGYGRWIGRKP